MSRIGKKPIEIPEGINVALEGNNLVVKGQEKTLIVPVHYLLDVKVEEKLITVTRKSDVALARSVHGLTRTLISNAIDGLTKGFEKQLEIVGVGYKAQVEGDSLILKVGYSHEVKKDAPEGISFDVKKNIVTVKGHDKQMVGQVAAEIRAVRKPEPYKGKGIKYVGEKIIRKVGKAVKGSGA